MRGEVSGINRSPPEPRVDARVQELTEMTIGRTDDPKKPVETSGSRSRWIVWDRIADSIWASDHAPRQQAEHMIAVDPPVRFLFDALEPEGPFSNRVAPVNSLLLT